MKKRIFSMFLAAVMLFGVLPVSVFAAEESATEEATSGTMNEVVGETTGATAAEDAVITMTVSNKGALALVNGIVTVKDTNADGVLTYHEALEAAHAVYCPNGYTAAESEWGISVSTIWGVETYNSLYFRNGEKLANHVGNTETSTVVEGDCLVVSVNKDDQYYGDRYSKFNASAKNVVVGNSITLNLKADLSTGSAAVPNATIGTWKDGVFTPLEGKTTDAKGNVTLSFTETGTYIVSASGTVSDTVQDWSNGGADVTADCPIIAPVCVVTVTEVPRLGGLNISREWADNGNYYTMSPAFDPMVTEYTLMVPDYAASVFPYATLAEGTEGKGICYYGFNGMWGSFVWSSSNNISVSGDYFGVVIYDKTNGMSTEDIRYTVAFGKYATLKSLTVDGIGSLAFDRNTTDGYHYYVDSTQDGVDITATANKSNYTVTIGGSTITSGETYRLAYNWDESGKMEVPVTVSGDKVATTTYTLTLEKQPLNDAPYIMIQPVGAEYTVIDKSVAALNVEASANGDMTYQWYYNTSDSNENGTSIEGATESAYTPPITEDVIGTRYYYCVVTNTGKTEGNVTVSNTACVTVDPDPTPKAVITNPGAAMPEDYEYAWDTGYIYNVGDAATPLTVTATANAEGGTWSYKWRAVSRPYNNNGGSSVSGDSASESYTPTTEVSIANSAGKYYGCQVTYTFKGKSYTSWATTGQTYTDGEGDSAETYDVIGVYVFVKVDKAETPTITKQPVGASYMEGDSMQNLSVSASKTDGGKLSYQWYVNDSGSNEGGTAIESATSRSYKLGTASEGGTKYYYCVVTNTIQGYTSSVSSEAVEITVKTVQELVSDKLSGTGTAEDPYLIENAQDYQDVYDLVAAGLSFQGMYLKQVNDITLADGWKSIGVRKDPSISHINRGANMHPFSGILDGNGKTVTVPEGCEPLLGYVKGAAVKNLNIYGKQIAGYGLVNHLEGVGLSGEAICIDNVTLKSGSSTLKSGLIGTYITNNGFAGCSAAFYVTIKNCTIEKDVVIGYNKDQSMIGSIAGRIHGTIDNCVSYATVYGTDYVGGILGTRDNAMGGCVVTNSQFHGAVEATGTQVGGIVGGGYCNSTAPNGAKVNIQNCSVTGTVTGRDKVGGVVGADTYVVQLWGTHMLKDNSFTGTVKATDGTYVGGIIGYYASLNKYDDISGNYYAANCGVNKGIGFVQYVDTDCATHETTSGATYINTAEGESGIGGITKTNHNRTDDPLGADAAKLCYTDSTPVTATELKVSGIYKTAYTTGDKLDLSGIVLTVGYTDQSEETINLSDATVTGYDASKVGEQELTISYNGLTAAITVTVKNPAGTIQVTVSVYGDSKHGTGDSVHTLSGGGLTTWVSAKTYTVDSNSTVWDVLQKVFADNGITCNANASNSQGTVYISSLTRNGVTLSEFDNGTNSGWMYTLNGVHLLNGVAQQYLKDGDKIIFHYTDDYTKEEGSSGDEDNKDAEASGEQPAEPKTDAVTEDIYKTTGDYLEALGTPVPGSVGGEWLVIGLSRSDREISGVDDYYEAVVKYVQENIDENERLHSAKSTDNSRLILALTALGKDVTDVDGHNLLVGLNDMEFIQKQGLNGPIWALIALDSGNYPVPEGDVSREALIQVILDAQLADGGWALSGETADADMTGMAVQALAPYYERNADVKKALDEAVEAMSKLQAADGSYGSIDGASSESIAQIIVALAALGIDADKDQRFIKNGISALDALCAFYVDGGGFRHLMDGELDGMATEQGYYALTAYFRMLDGKTGLYNMRDVIDLGGDVEAQEQPTGALTGETEPAPTVSAPKDEDKGGFPWWILLISAAGAAILIAVPVLKRKRMK